MLGKGAVGKTSLIFRFVHNRIPKEHDPTVEDFYHFNLKTKSGEREIHILDTAGEEDYQDMLDKWISQASGFILVFAINDLETFTSLKKVIIRIKENEADNLPFVVVGNKCDLGLKREVTIQQGEELAKSLGAKYLETSALTDSNGNVKVAFELCGNMIINKTRKIDDDGKCCCPIF